MSTVTEIKRAIQKLPSKDRSKLTTWIVEQDSDAWDKQMAADAAAGKLDFLIAEAAAARKTSKLRNWPARSH
jgi:hypothetical protein